MREGVVMGHHRDRAAPGVIAPLEVPRNLLRDAVFARLLGAILRGDYRRGQRLRLDEIAADLGVSRTPVREALVPLESLQLVLVQRYVGVVIADWDVDHVIERLRLVRRLLADPPVRRAGSGAADSGGAASTGQDPGLLADVRTHVGAGGSAGIGGVVGLGAGALYGVDGRFDAARARESASEAGVACLLAEWAFRRRGCPVSADLVAAMRPLLDQVFSEDVARRHGIDVVVDRRVRLAVLDRACTRAVAGDVDGAVRATIELVDALAALPERFRPSSAAS